MPQELTDLMYAGIFSPDFGEREDIPNILLPDGMTAENVNILQRYGQLSRLKGRIPEFLEQAYTNGTGATPVAVTNGSKIITGTGTAWYTSATQTPKWHGRKITLGGVDYVIDTVDSATQITLTVVYAGTSGNVAYSIGTAGTKCQTPDGNPILHYHRLVAGISGALLEYFVAFTKNHIYLWSTSWHAWIDKTVSGGLSDTTWWDTVTFNGQIIATNNVDKVLSWGSTTGNAFGILGSANGIDIGGATYLTKAKFVTEYEGYLFFGFVVVGGTVYSNDLYWSDKDATTFDQTGSGDTGNLQVPGNGLINGFGKYGSDLVVGKTESLFRMWLVTTSEIFNLDAIFTGVGVIGAHSMVNDKQGRFYWLADDYTFRMLPGGDIISAAKDKTVKAINATYQDNIEAVFIAEYGLLWWSIPHSISATGNNKILWTNPDKGTWGEVDCAVAAFGTYRRQEVWTIDTIPFDTIDEIGWETIDSIENVVGFPLDIASDYSGYSYDLHTSDKDNGEDYDGYFVLSLDPMFQAANKQLGTSLRNYKRLEEMKLYFNEVGQGTASVYLKRDNEPNWQTVGAVSLEGDNSIVEVDLPCDFRAKHFLIKVSAQNRFDFLGLIVGFLLDGDR